MADWSDREDHPDGEHLSGGCQQKGRGGFEAYHLYFPLYAARIVRWEANGLRNDQSQLRNLITRLQYMQSAARNDIKDFPGAGLGCFAAGVAE